MSPSPATHSGYPSCTSEDPSGEHKPAGKRDPSDHHRRHRLFSCFATNLQMSLCGVTEKKNWM
jgi:hypothetical protein